MKIKNIFTILLVCFILVSCSPATAPSAPAPTSTPSPAPSTSTPTTSLETKLNSDLLIEYAEAFTTAYPNNQALYTPEVVMARLTPETVIGADGVSYQFMVDPQTRVPVLMMSNPETGEQGWRPVCLKDVVNIPGGIEKIGSVNSMYPGFYKDVNAATINTMWSVFEPRDDQYDFSLFDVDVSDMRAHGLDVTGQSIVYLSQDWALPNWIINGDFTREEVEKIITDHVTTVIQHGKALGVTQWGIVNEPFFQGEREHDKFYQIFGGYDYIDIAFRAARKADPDAILYYNDYANHTSIRSEQRPSSIPKVELTKQIIQRLRNITVTGDDGIARSVIDAVGVQSHLGGWVGEPSDYTNVEETLRSYGLPVIVTEFDVTVENMTGTHAEILRHQAQVYGDYLRAVYRSGVVKQVIFWGLTDEVAINSGKPNYDTAPAIIDQYNKPKLAYYEVLKVLFEQVQNLSQ